MTRFSTILICGSRDFTERNFFWRAMDRWVARHGMPHAIVEGCARGADSLAEDWANAHGVDIDGYGSTPGEHGPFPPTVQFIRHFPADWDRHGRAAGPIRNQQMLTEGAPDAVIAFTHSLRRSKGTRDMVIRARRAGLPVWLPVPGSDDPTAR